MSTITTQCILNELVQDYGQSSLDIAQHIGVSHRTIQRLLHGYEPSMKTEIHLIQFYAHCQSHKARLAHHCSP